MSKPDTAREILDSFNSCKHEDRSLAIFEAEQLVARVEKVLELHKRGAGFDFDVCYECGDPWPCETTRLLNGEEP